MTADERYALIRQKFERARKHFHELDTELRNFWQTGPFEVSSRRDPESRKPIYCVAKADPPPPGLPLMIGDVIQGLRSTLEHLAFQLLMVGSPGVVDPDWVKFPIGKDSPAYRSQLGRVRQGMRPAAVDCIDSIEPFGGGKGAILWTLHELNNIDKHRALLTAFVPKAAVDIAPDFLRADLPDWAREIWEEAKLEVFIREAPTEPAKVGDTIYEGMPDAPMGERKFKFDLVFGEPESVLGRPVIPALVEMARAVDETVSRFWKEGHLS